VRRLAGEEGLLAAMDANRLDAVVAPSTSRAWLTDLAMGDRFSGSGYGIAAAAGMPSVNVPMGESFNLPLGLVFMGREYSEGELLGFAYAFEQATQARKAPDLKPTLPH
jgi:amidase